MRGATLAAVLIAACGHPSAPAVSPPAAPAASGPVVSPPPDASYGQEEKLAAIQKAINDVYPAAQQCWAAAATVRFDIEGEITTQIDIGDGSSHAAIVHDTARNQQLADCLVKLLSTWKYAPPIIGDSIQIPFKFRAPDGQSVIDRRLVEAHAQGKIAVSVLLDENNTGNGAASMFEVAIEPGASTGMRVADRSELWFFPETGDMMYVPRGAAREIKHAHAVVVVVPGGREGSARAGALPTREGTSTTKPRPLPAKEAKPYGPATIYLDASVEKATPLAASILQLPAGAKVAEHAHAHETEMLYVLAGSGTMTIAGTDVPVTPTSVIQIPPNTKHSFTATEAVRSLQIYTPAGPEQRFKAKP